MVMDIDASRQVDDAVDYGRSSTEDSTRESEVAFRQEETDSNMIQEQPPLRTKRAQPARARGHGQTLQITTYTVETPSKRRRVADKDISAPDEVDASGDNGAHSTVDSLRVGMTDNVVLDANTSYMGIGMPKRTARQAGLQENSAKGKKPLKE